MQVSKEFRFGFTCQMVPPERQRLRGVPSSKKAGLGGAVVHSGATGKQAGPGLRFREFRGTCPRGQVVKPR